MAQANIESDPLFTLLTDALRAGPGSPQWSQAVAAVRERGAEGTEYEALVTARENLESGREYRTVQAGAGFTRKLMTQIESNSQPKKPGLATAVWIAAFAGIALLVIIGLIAMLIMPGTPPQASVDHLANLYFATPLQTLKFDGPLPEDWKTIGTLPLEVAHNLRATLPGPKDTVGGGIYWSTPINPDQPTAVEASFHINRPIDEVTAQLFITDKPDFSPDRGSSSHELVWQTKGQTAQVFLPNGLSDGHVEKSKDVRDRTVRIVFNKELAAIDMNGTRLWSGANQLSTTEPRYVGVRLIRVGADKSDAVVVTGLKVLKQ